MLFSIVRARLMCDDATTRVYVVDAAMVAALIVRYFSFHRLSISTRKCGASSASHMGKPASAPVTVAVAAAARP